MGAFSFKLFFLNKLLLILHRTLAHKLHHSQGSSAATVDWCPGRLKSVRVAIAYTIPLCSDHTCNAVWFVGDKVLPSIWTSGVDGQHQKLSAAQNRKYILIKKWFLNGPIIVIARAQANACIGRNGYACTAATPYFCPPGNAKFIYNLNQVTCD